MVLFRAYQRTYMTDRGHLCQAYMTTWPGHPNCTSPRVTYNQHSNNHLHPNIPTTCLPPHPRKPHLHHPNLYPEARGRVLSSGTHNRPGNALTLTHTLHSTHATPCLLPYPHTIPQPRRASPLFFFEQTSSRASAAVGASKCRPCARLKLTLWIILGVFTSYNTNHPK